MRGERKTLIVWLSGRRLAARAGLALVAGMLTGLGFQPVGWWPLVLLGVGLLTLVVMASDKVVGSALLGLLFGLGLLGVGLNWMQVIFVQAMVGLIAVESLFYALLGAGLHLALRVSWWPILAAAWWTAVEFAFARFPFDGFGWMRLGYAMIDSPLAGAYPLVGVAGVSFITALLAQLALWLVVGPTRARAVTVSLAALSLATLIVGGTLVPAGRSQANLSVGYVQGGAPGGGVYGLGPARTITSNQAVETERLADQVAAKAAPEPDFVVWPENSTDMDPFLDSATGELVRSAVDRIGVPILVGSILDGPGQEQRQTASLWWDPVAGAQQRYIKRGIVPFGEWIPFRSWLLPLIPELRYVGAQSVAGTAPGVIKADLDSGPLKLGVLVCYDLAFDNIAYDTVRNGAGLIVVQSSNAMYQGTGQIEQQFAITRARAMELRREILVVTTSGVSGFISPTGAVVFDLPDPAPASGVVTMPVRDGVSPAARFAPWLELALVAISLGGLAHALFYGRIATRQSSNPSLDSPGGDND